MNIELGMFPFQMIRHIFFAEPQGFGDNNKGAKKQKMQVLDPFSHNHGSGKSP